MEDRIILDNLNLNDDDFDSLVVSHIDSLK